MREPQSAPGPSGTHTYHGRLEHSYSQPAENQIHPLATHRRRNPQRQLSRAMSIRDAVSSGAANFFGVASKSDGTAVVEPDKIYEDKRWAARRMRHANRRYGPVKEPPPDQQLNAGFEDAADMVCALPTPPSAPSVRDPLSLRRLQTQASVESQMSVMTIGRSTSTDNKSPSKIELLERRDSVAKMAWERIGTLISRGTLKPRRPTAASVRRQRLQSRSFTPGSVAVEDDVFTYGSISPSVSPCTAGTMPDSIIMETIKEVPSRQPSLDVEVIEAEVRQEERVPPPSAHIYSEVPDERDETDEREETDALRRTYQAPATVSQASPADSSLQDDVFYDITPAPLPPHREHRAHRDKSPRPFQYPPPVLMKQRSEPGQPIRRRGFDFERPVPGAKYTVAVDESRQQVRPIRGMRRLKKQQAIRQQTESIRSNIFTRARDAVTTPAQSKRRLGEGIVGKWFGRRLKKKSELSPHVRQQLSDFDDYRPYFTYWVSTVQLLVAIISVCLYGFGPFGFGIKEHTANVLHSSVTMKQVAYFEERNFWLGPSYRDLVHLGAKFSPCMRHDENVYSAVNEDRKAENDTGCCIYNDKTGCFQTSQCPELIAQHNKWSVSSPGPGGRTAGTVCGQDPRACDQPASVSPFEWIDDLTKWPICTSPPPHPLALDHLECEVTGRPCCVGLHGQCRIATREYCDFVKGYFHEEATLCSQVSCLGEVCGMIPFISRDNPNQFYRLFISIFLHAGLIHCCASLVIQWLLMRDLEKLVGWHRISLVYLVSGIGGNLASAIFVPYRPDVGPSASLAGLLAALFVDAIYSWEMLSSPWKAIGQLVGITVALLLVGLLPWVDNWANMFGFLFGLLVCLSVFPYIQFSHHDRVRRMIIVVVSLVVLALLFTSLILFFYVYEIWDCSFCSYFTCIPLSDHFCDNQGISLKLLPI